MPTVKSYERLVEHFRRAPAEAGDHLREALQKKDLKPADFSFAQLFEACYGYAEFKACRDGHKLATTVFEEDRARLQEAGQGAVTSDMFGQIVLPIVSATTLDAYESEEFVFSKLIPEVKATDLNGERMVGYAEIGDEAAVRPETFPYPLVGPGPNWVQTPPIKDRGYIVPLTWEVIFQDRPGKLLDVANDRGRWMGVNKEKRAIDAVIDENTTDHRYNWRGTVIATYGDNSGSHTWDNLVATNALVDWTDLNNAEQAFNDMVDPFTGEPISVTPKHLIAVNALSPTMWQILNSTQLAIASPGYATTGNPTNMTMANMYLNKYMPVTSKLLAARLGTDTSWFLGDIGRAVKYMVAEPISTVEAPPNNVDDFHRRIVKQFRTNERGQHVVVEPRAIVKSTA